MSVEIQNLVTSQLLFNDMGELELSKSSNRMDTSISENEEMVHSILGSVNAKSCAYGAFSQDSDFKLLLQKYASNSINFNALHSEITERIARDLVSYSFADDGTLVVSEFLSLGRMFILISITKNKAGLELNPLKQAKKIKYLDTDNLSVACLISMDGISSDEPNKREIIFSKGKRFRSVKSFLFNLLGAESGIDSKHQTLCLSQAVTDYSHDQGLDSSERFSLKKSVFDYCNDKNKLGEDVHLEELSYEISISESFYDFVDKQGYEISESFPSDPSSLKELITLSGRGGGIRISIDSIILNERVFYDPETDILTIKGTPPNLRDQLQREGRH